MTETAKELPLSERPTKISFSRQNSDTSSPSHSTTSERRASILRNGTRSFTKRSVELDGNSNRSTGRSHKVSFSDELVKVKEVENWKRYNLEEDYGGKNCCELF